MAETPQSSQWDEEILYFTGDDYFGALVESLQRARSTIELESYIFIPGQLGDRIVQTLVEAAQRGVKVRLIVDGFGSPQFYFHYRDLLKQAGIRVRYFRVIPWMIRKMPGDPQGLFARILRRWRQMNRGNHRKFALIDKSILYVGSFNISDLHVDAVSGLETWKDLGVRVQGSDLRYAHRAFNRTFRGWTAFNFPALSPKLLLLNDSYLHKRSSQHQILDQLNAAKSRIWMATPYFVPVSSVFRTLVKQAQRGLDVRLIIPQKNDVFFIPWLSIPLIRELVRKGVKVFVYRPRFAHQKLFIIDDWACIGSTNLNHRSFLHDLELDVVISQEANRQKLVQSFLNDQASSEPFDRSNWGILPIWQRLLAQLFIVLKYWA